ncbi:Polyadenylate-binding protein 2 [Portunus trituberculatus]|uniref:Polyadenylate-binding protein 2 n=1 Tax=Portunus trituberculatus TaxID=210409 RepID=A0A5B7K8J1_PORTR|nr:Polyadenylate-binding protein 2 [Portunus trituberculatus]
MIQYTCYTFPNHHPTARVREMEEEAEKIRQIQSEVDKQMSLGSPPGAAGATSPLNMSLEEKMEVDARSIYVGNVSSCGYNAAKCEGCKVGVQDSTSVR